MQTDIIDDVLSLHFLFNAVYLIVNHKCDLLQLYISILEARTFYAVLQMDNNVAYKTY